MKIKCACVWWQDSSAQNDGEWRNEEYIAEMLTCFNTKDTTFSCGVIAHETEEEICLASATARDAEDGPETWDYCGVISIPKFAITKTKRFEV